MNYVLLRRYEGSKDGWETIGIFPKRKHAMMMLVLLIKSDEPSAHEYDIEQR